nr:uncharacterized protein CI109_002278 [Kwoniella shandongensis]KAA5529385.1 hypothetical protein CI109_002278 [Kwoniella shandongensis]
MILRHLCSALALLLPLTLALSHAELQPQISQLFNTTSDGHTNNWAVLVCSSRYWFNYRHMANTLAMYRTLKRLGLPDSNIILMLADDVACNARNAFPATVYANSGRQMDLYGDGIEVDYRGYEVTVESFLRLLTGRHAATTPRSKRLLSDASSNVFVYMTGHGGNEFLKFQDNEEVSAYDVADAIEQMYEKRRYNKLLYVIDTCQANTMYSKFYSPEVISTGSSGLGENSYSHHNDLDIGVAVIDSFTHNILQYLETLGKSSKASLQEFFNTYDPAKIASHPGISTSLSSVPPDDILVTDFFGAVASVEVLPRDAELPLSARQADSWEVASGRSRGIEGNTLSEPPVQVKHAGGWKRPLEEKEEYWKWVPSHLILGAAFIALYISLGDKIEQIE